MMKDDRRWIADNKGISNNEQGILNDERLQVKPRAEDGGWKTENQENGEFRIEDLVNGGGSWLVTRKRSDCLEKQAYLGFQYSFFSVIVFIMTSIFSWWHNTLYLAVRGMA